MITKNHHKLSQKNFSQSEHGTNFVRQLMNWNKKKNTRDMPWKGEKDPYRIWLSEIILQQTRVEQGLKYYEKFITAFPTMKALAQAPEEKVFKMWEGLGYYSRCKNLISTAKWISNERDGIFPRDFDTILSLKGVGNYTASAISSFAYNLPHAVLDGNVFRVLSRIFEVETAIDSNKGKKQFIALAQEILPKKKAGKYNQAIMDFGAVICKPYPECSSCFFNKHCLAYLSGKQDLLPVKEKKIKLKERWLNYFIIKCGDKILIRQRREKDIWQHLFEFFLVETKQSYPAIKILNLFEKQYGIKDFKLLSSSTFKQKLSHQLVHFSFLEVEVKEEANFPGFIWVKRSQLKKYAFPKTLQQYILSAAIK